MTKMRIMSVVTALSLAIALFTAVASAAGTGVMVISGGVTLDGANAPAGTTVTAALADGTVLGAGNVGDGGADVYRIDVQVDSTWEGLSANLNVGGATQATQATVVIKANSHVAQDITAAAVPGSAVATATAAVAVDSQATIVADVVAAITADPPAALKGAAGAAGKAGAAGAAGAAGDAGAAGAAGADGAAGAAGADGKDGAAGLAGAAGTQGPPGGPGTVGAAGGGGLTTIALVLAALGLAVAGYALFKVMSK